MVISEAVKQALEKEKCITLPGIKAIFKIKPTNDVGNCIIMGADGSNPSKHGWQPTAKDLIREDWILVD